MGISINITEILSLSDLAEEIAEGYVTERTHPEFPNLVILNYTPKAQFSNHWTPVTMVTRGLIYDTESGAVLARPYAKFFNYGQGEVQFDLDEEIFDVQDKLDGSLGIGYLRPDGLPAIATRGSFDSDQARHATWLVGEDSTLSNYIMDEIESWSCTPLFEIIYPENRIVLDYGDEDKLVYLSSINMHSGIVEGGMPPIESASRFNKLHTLRDVLEQEPRPNSEGFVVWLDSTHAVKIKQQDYVELHRVVTGLNRKSIWRALADGYPTYQALLEQVPDELTEWAKSVGDDLMVSYAERVRDLDEVFVGIQEELYNAGVSDRKAFASVVQLAVSEKDKGYMFSLFDGRDISTKVWAELEPVGGAR